MKNKEKVIKRLAEIIDLMNLNPFDFMVKEDGVDEEENINYINLDFKVLKGDGSLIDDQMLTEAILLSFVKDVDKPKEFFIDEISSVISGMILTDKEKHAIYALE